MHKQQKGHLEPLDRQLESAEPIPCLDDMPSVEEFFKDFVYQSQPVIVRAASLNWPAIEEWSDEKLASRFGEEFIDVEVGKKDLRIAPSLRMPFREFLERYRQEDIYAVTDLPARMVKDIELPKCLSEIEKLASFIKTSAVFWMNDGGARSSLHLDTYENLSCVIAGKKNVLLAPPEYHSGAKIIPEFGYSMLDVDHVDFSSFEKVGDIPFQKAELNAGDVIYIPEYWLHQITSVGRSIAVNYWWREWIQSKESDLTTLIASHMSRLESKRRESGSKADDVGRPLQLFLAKQIERSIESRESGYVHRFEFCSLFSTSIYLSHLPDFKRINVKIEEFLRNLQKEDEETSVPAEKGYNPHGLGYTSYFSDRTNQIITHPDTQELVSFLVKCSVEYTRTLGFQMQNYKFGIDRIWLNIGSQGAYHMPHRHPGSVVSGVYYVRVPEPTSGGELAFRDPLAPYRMAEPEVRKDPGRTIIPHSGMLVLFPSWLEHEVKLQRSPDRRISLAFNCFATRDRHNSR